MSGCRSAARTRGPWTSKLPAVAVVCSGAWNSQSAGVSGSKTPAGSCWRRLTVTISCCNCPVDCWQKHAPASLLHPASVTVVSDCLITISRRRWNKRDRLSAATWLAMVSCLSSTTSRSLTTDENGIVAFDSFCIWTVTLSSCWRVPSRMICVFSSFGFRRLQTTQSRIRVMHVVRRSVASEWSAAGVLM